MGRTRYAPTLAGTACDGVTIRQALRMSSGVTFDEDYFAFRSDINRMGRVLALGMVIRGATGRSVVELMGERLLTPLGLESDPCYVTDGNGVAFALGGLNMMTRDYARFGQLFLQEGEWNGEPLVPAWWVAESTTPSANTAPGMTRYGYQWWIPADAGEGEFLARGVYGQFVYVNRPAGVVIAVNSADRGFREPGVFDGLVVRFREIAAALETEEIDRE